MVIIPNSLTGVLSPLVLNAIETARSIRPDLPGPLTGVPVRQVSQGLAEAAQALVDREGANSRTIPCVAFHKKIAAGVPSEMIPRELKRSFNYLSHFPSLEEVRPTSRSLNPRYFDLLAAQMIEGAKFLIGYYAGQLSGDFYPKFLAVSIGRWGLGKAAYSLYETMIDSPNNRGGDHLAAIIASLGKANLGPAVGPLLEKIRASVRRIRFARNRIEPLCLAADLQIASGDRGGGQRALQKLLVSARRIKQASQRVKSLLFVAESLAKAEMREPALMALSQADEDLRAAEEGLHHRMFQLLRIADGFERVGFKERAGEIHAEYLTQVRNIAPPETRASLLAVYAECLAASGRRAEAAEFFMESIVTYSRAREWIWTVVSVCDAGLGEAALPLFEKIIGSVKESEDVRERTAVLRRIAKRLGRAGFSARSGELLDEQLWLARQTKALFARLRDMLDVAAAFFWAGSKTRCREVHEEVMSSLGRIEDVREKTSLKKEVAKLAFLLSHGDPEEWL